MKTLERIIEKVAQMEYEWYPSVSYFFEEDENYLVASFSDDFIVIAREKRMALDNEMYEKVLFIDNTVKGYIDLIVYCFSTLQTLGDKSKVESMWKSANEMFSI